MTKRLRLGIESKLRLGDLLDAMTQRGWSQHETAVFLGIRYQLLNQMLNLTYVPTPKFVERHPAFEQKWLELTGRLLEDTWPAWTQTDAGRGLLAATPKRLITFSEVQPGQLAAASAKLALPPAFENNPTREDLEVALRAAMKTLTPREQKVIEMRFFQEKTLDQVSKEFSGVGVERIRQIEAKALRRLRHPERSKALRPFAEVDPDEPWRPLGDATNRARNEARVEAEQEARRAEMSRRVREEAFQRFLYRLYHQPVGE